jgi:hypothetical protein
MDGDLSLANKILQDQCTILEDLLHAESARERDQSDSSPGYLLEAVIAASETGADMNQSRSEHLVGL